MVSSDPASGGATPAQSPLYMSLLEVLTTKRGGNSESGDSSSGSPDMEAADEMVAQVQEILCERDSLQSEVERFEGSVSFLKGELKAAGKERDELRALALDRDELAAEVEEAHGHRARLEASLATTEEQLRHVTSNHVRVLEEMANNVRRGADPVHLSVKQLSERLAKAQTAAAASQRARVAAEATAEAARAEAAECRAEMAKWRSDRKTGAPPMTATTHLSPMEESAHFKRTLMKALATAIRYKQELESLQQLHARDSEAKAAELRSRLDAMAGERGALKEDARARQEDHSLQLATWKKEMEALRQELSEREKALADAQAQRDALQGEVSSALAAAKEAAKKTVAGQRREEQARESLAAESQKVRDLEARLAAAEDSTKALEEDLKAATAQKDQTAGELSANTKESDEARARLAEMEAAAAKMQKDLAEGAVARENLQAQSRELTTKVHALEAAAKMLEQQKLETEQQLKAKSRELADVQRRLEEVKVEFTSDMKVREAERMEMLDLKKDLAKLEDDAAHLQLGLKKSLAQVIRCKEELEGQRRETARAAESEAGLSARLNALQKEHDTLSSELAESGIAAAGLEGHSQDDQSAALEELQGRCEQLQAQLATAKADAQEQRDQLARADADSQTAILSLQRQLEDSQMKGAENEALLSEKTKSQAALDGRCTKMQAHLASAELELKQQLEQAARLVNSQVEMKFAKAVLEKDLQLAKVEHDKTVAQLSEKTKQSDQSLKQLADMECAAAQTREELQLYEQQLSGKSLELADVKHRLKEAQAKATSADEAQDELAKLKTDHAKAVEAAVQLQAGLKKSLGATIKTRREHEGQCQALQTQLTKAEAAVKAEKDLAADKSTVATQLEAKLQLATKNHSEEAHKLKTELEGARQQLEAARAQAATLRHQLTKTGTTLRPELSKTQARVQELQRALEKAVASRDKFKHQLGAATVRMSHKDAELLEMASLLGDSSRDRDRLLEQSALTGAQATATASPDAACRQQTDESLTNQVMECSRLEECLREAKMEAASKQEELEQCQGLLAEGEAQRRELEEKLACAGRELDRALAETETLRHQEAATLAGLSAKSSLGQHAGKAEEDVAMLRKELDQALEMANTFKRHRQQTQAELADKTKECAALASKLATEQEQAGRLQTQRKAEVASLEAQLTDLQTQLAAAVEALSEKRLENESLQERSATSDAELAEARAALDKAGTQMNLYQDLHAQTAKSLAAKEAEVEALQAQLSEARLDAERTARELDAASRSIADLQEDLNGSKRELAEMSTERDGLAEKIAATESQSSRALATASTQKAEVDAALSAKTSECERLDSTLLEAAKETAAAREALKHAKDELAAATEKAQVDHQTFQEVRARLAREEEEVARLREAVDESASQRANLMSELDLIQGQLAAKALECERTASALQAANGKSTQLQARLDDAGKQAGVYKEQLEEAGAALVERSCESDELRRKLEALEQEAASNLEELASDMQRHSTLSQSASASLAQQLAEAQLALSSALGQSTIVQEELDCKREECEHLGRELLESNQRADALEDRIRTLELELQTTSDKLVAASLTAQTTLAQFRETEEELKRLHLGLQAALAATGRLESELSEANRHRDELASQLAEANALSTCKMAAASTQHMDLARALETRNEQCNRLSAELEEAVRLLASAKEDSVAQSEALEALDKECRDARSRLATVEPELVVLRQELGEAQTALAAANQTEAELKRLLGEKNVLATELETKLAAAADHQAEAVKGVADELAEVRGERDELAEQLAETQAQLMGWSTGSTQLRADLAARTQQRDDLKDELDRLTLKVQRQAQALKVLELARAKEAQALSEMMDEAASTDATSEEHMLMLSKSVTRLRTEVASLMASLDKCRSENDHLVSERVALLAHKAQLEGELEELSKTELHAERRKFMPMTSEHAKLKEQLASVKRERNALERAVVTLKWRLAGSAKSSNQQQGSSFRSAPQDADDDAHLLAAVASEAASAPPLKVSTDAEATSLDDHSERLAILVQDKSLLETQVEHLTKELERVEGERNELQRREEERKMSLVMLGEHLAAARKSRDELSRQLGVTDTEVKLLESVEAELVLSQRQVIRLQREFDETSEVLMETETELALARVKLLEMESLVEGARDVRAATTETSSRAPLPPSTQVNQWREITQERDNLKETVRLLTEQVYKQAAMMKETQATKEVELGKQVALYEKQALAAKRSAKATPEERDSHLLALEEEMEMLEHRLDIALTQLAHRTQERDQLARTLEHQPSDVAASDTASAPYLLLKASQAQSYSAVRKERDELARRLDDLLPQMAGASSAEKRTAQMSEDLEWVRRQRDDMQAQRDAALAKANVLPALEEELAELMRQQTALKTERDELASELAATRLALEEQCKDHAHATRQLALVTQERDLLESEIERRGPTAPWYRPKQQQEEAEAAHLQALASGDVASAPQQVAARQPLPDPESGDVSTLRRERDELLVRLKEMMPQVAASANELEQHHSTAEKLAALQVKYEQLVSKLGDSDVQVAKLGGVEAVQADTLKQLVTLKRERDELAVQLAQAEGEVDLLKIELFEMSKHFQGSKGTIGYRGRVHDVQYLANLQARRMSPRKDAEEVAAPSASAAASGDVSRAWTSPDTELARVRAERDDLAQKLADILPQLADGMDVQTLLDQSEGSRRRESILAAEATRETAARLGLMETRQADTVTQLGRVREERDELAVQLRDAEMEVNLLKIEVQEMARKRGGSIGYHGKVHFIMSPRSLEQATLENKANGASDKDLEAVAASTAARAPSQEEARSPVPSWLTANQRMQLLTQERDELASKLAELVGQMNSINTPRGKDWAEERAELARQLSSMRQQRDAALAQAGRLSSLEVQNANLVEQLMVLKKERDSLARQVNEAETELAILREEMQQEHAKATDGSRVTRYTEARPRKSTGVDLSDLSRIQQERDDLASRLAELLPQIANDSALEDVSQEREAFRKERDELARQVESLRMNADRLKMSEAHAEEISKQLATVKKERDDFARQLSEGFEDEPGFLPLGAAKEAAPSAAEELRAALRNMTSERDYLQQRLAEATSSAAVVREKGNAESALGERLAETTKALERMKMQRDDARVKAQTYFDKCCDMEEEKAEAAKRLSELKHEQSELRRALSENVSERDLHAVAAASSRASPGGEEQRLLAEQLAEEMAQDMARKFAAELEARNRECDDLTAECDDLAKKLAQARLDSAEARTQLGRELAQARSAAAAAALSQDKIPELQTKLQQLRQQYTTMAQQVEARTRERDEALAKLATVTYERDTLAASASLAKEVNPDLEKKLRHLQQQHSQLAQQLEARTHERDEAQKKALRAKNEHAVLAEKLAEMESHPELKTTLRELQKQHAALSKQMTTLAKERDSACKQLASVEAERDGLSEQLADAEAQVAMIVEMEQRQREMSKGGDSADTVMMMYERERAARQQDTQRIKTLKQQSISARKEIDDLTRRLADYEKLQTVMTDSDWDSDTPARTVSSKAYAPPPP